jgi:hypothetical protein
MTDDANYDDVAALVRHKTKAQAVVVMVIDGKRGSGMAVGVRNGHTLSPAERDQMMLDVMRSHGSAAMQRDLGVEPRAVAPAAGEKGLPQLRQHRGPNDGDDQVLLRQIIGDELEAVLKKYEVGGVLLLVSRTAAAWRSVFPAWCGLQPDPVHVLRLRMGTKVPEVDADATMQLIASVREMCSDYANFYGRLWRQAVDALKAQGATVEHVPLGQANAVGGRPDPMGGKVE